LQLRLPHLQWPQHLHQLQPSQVPHLPHLQHQPQQHPQKNPDFSLNSTG
jgi:hypothetical protein